MTRLQTEFDRLYRPHGEPLSSAAAQTPASGLIDAQGRVRALVLELRRPADWPQLATLWRGVQADLALPAPAIAASGTDGLQLWFSVQEPLTVAQAHAFLTLLRQRYLPDVAAQRLRLLPAAPTDGTSSPQHAQPVPALQAASGNWSAFLAPDLAPIFAETPWLDVPPSAEGQASLLTHLASMAPAELAAAQAQLAPAPDAAASTAAAPAALPHPTLASPEAAAPPSTAPASHTPATQWEDPKRFLLAVMNDGSVPLALRIEAAKALLPRD